MSKPKELYRFVEGATVWTVTSADTAEVYNAETYTPITLGRTEAEVKNELSRANIEVSVDLGNAMAKRWLKTVIDDVVTLTVFAKDGVDVAVVWKGRLAAVKADMLAITLVFESVFTSLRRPGLRLKYQKSCPHTLYGRGCNLDKAAWEVTGPVSSVSGTTVVMPIAATYANGHFTAGMIKSSDGVYRFITGHTGDTLTLIRALDQLSEDFITFGAGGFSAQIYPGCNRTKEACKDKFNNILNMGGFPFIPNKNPFTGGSIV